MAALLCTSEVPFHSSVHGAQRRNQRNISKRDLQAAIKHGDKVRGNPRPHTGEPTWKFWFANITYITNDAMDTEITSYVDPLPLDEVQIPKRMLLQYNEAKDRNAALPGSITSHTVLVVDKSASMKKSDVDGHRTRARGAYYVLAEEFIAKQLNPVTMGTLGGNHTRPTDVVSLIEMRGNATVVFEREPLSWALYNKFVQLANRSDFMYSDCHGHGNYFESIEAALALLRSKSHDKLALSLFFLTDGRPSDHCRQDRRVAHLSPTRLLQSLASFASAYRDRFTFHAFGLGSDAFQVLDAMVEVVKGVGAVAVFGNGGRDLIALCDSLTSVATSTTSITSQLSRLHFKKENRVHVKVEKEEYNSSCVFDKRDWNVYIHDERPGVVVDRMERKFNRRANGIWRLVWINRPFLSDEAVGIAVKKKIFGEGAERIVFEMTEIDVAGEPVGIPLVAKDSKYFIDNPKDRKEFHDVFVATQKQASKFAEKFNKKLDAKGIDPMIPRVHFLPCCIYDCNIASSTYLAEKRLNVDRYKKWNDNAGGVDGIARINCAVVVPVQTDGGSGGGGLAAILEDLEEEEDSVDDDDDDESEDDELVAKKSGVTPALDVAAAEKEQEKEKEKDPAVLALEGRILDNDILQGFSHWTYCYSRRKSLVCDLQGELNVSGTVPFFELTDPCILSPEGKRNGGTDKGHHGMTQFFSTHHCDPVCTLLGIDRKPH